MPNKMCLNVREKFVDIILEKRWNSAQAEIHNQKIEKAITGAENGFPFFSFSHPNFVENNHDI